MTNRVKSQEPKIREISLRHQDSLYPWSNQNQLSDGPKHEIICSAYTLTSMFNKSMHAQITSMLPHFHRHLYIACIHSSICGQENVSFIYYILAWLTINFQRHVPYTKLTQSRKFDSIQSRGNRDILSSSHMSTNRHTNKQTNKQTWSKRWPHQR